MNYRRNLNNFQSYKDLKLKEQMNCQDSKKKEI